MGKIKYITSGILITVLFCFQLAGSALVYADNGDGTTEGNSGTGTSGGSGTTTESTDTSITPTSVNLSSFLTTSEQKNQPTTIGAYIVRVINFLTLGIASFGILAVIVGGFFLLTAAGREEQITRGKDMIKFAIIGIVAAVSAYWLVAAIQSLFY